MNLRLALLISALAGFLALSYEILWFRVYGFLTGGSPGGFGVVLGFYLLGIAFGSLFVRRVCDDRALNGDPQRLVLPAWLVLAATLGGWLLLPAVADLVRIHNYRWSLPGVALVAGLMGAVLPLIAHFGVPADERAGERLSWIYLANIAGSTLGSLTTGFVLMQYLSTPQIAQLLALAGLALTTLLVLSAKQSRMQLAKWLPALAILAMVLHRGTPSLYDFLYEKLMFKEHWKPGDRFAQTLENRSGIIHVSQNGAIYGSGMYDGVFNTDLIDDRNMVVRAYALAGMREKYPEVLMIGLSSGSWAQVIASNPGVGKLTVIEINPGYPEVDSHFPGVASVLKNPKVEVIVDDGRRWLTAHPDRKFDLVVQNTTWHWRGHITNLLSGEYLELVKQHLTPDGVFFWNTTWSLPAQKTGCTHFKHGFRLINFIAASDAPLVLDRELWRKRLTEYRIDGQPVFDLTQPKHQQRLEDVLRYAEYVRDPPGLDAETCAHLLARTQGEPLVTDDNMVTEWDRPWNAQPVGGD